jgi:crotonobetainyl-CoA:carnitine CoA-transferase CaiB-like acyl-CoA transferase
MVLPLEGVTVVSCEQAVAAPLASRQLADLGARVIKIERPGGGDFARRYDRTVRGLSSHFVWLNRSKESVTLDLKDAADRTALLRLIDGADVFLQNYGPGAAERLGLGAEQLRDTRPELICCSVSGYGTSGPLRDAKAYDLLVQAETGLVSITGTEDAPAKSGIPAADIAAGLYAFSAVLAALYHRALTGEGATLHVNLFDSLLEWMGYPLYYTRYGGRQPRRAGTSHAAIAPYGTFRAGDGTAVVLSVQNEGEWLRFCEVVLQRPDLATAGEFATQPARVAHRSALDAEIDSALAALDGDELVRRLETAGIANARQRDLVDVIDHPQLTERDRWVSLDTPAGVVQALRPPIEWAGMSLRMDAVPDVGQHTSIVLGELADPGA